MKTQKDSYGNTFTIVDGRIQVEVRDLTKKAGVEDTVSWWKESGKLNVLVQPDMKYSPVQVKREGDNISIVAYVTFTGDANETFKEIDALGNVITTSSYTYGELAYQGIKDNWKGNYQGTDYDFEIGKNIKLNTTIYCNNQSPNNVFKNVTTSKKQNFLTINITAETFGNEDVSSASSHTGRGKWDWSFVNPGTIELYDNYKGDDKGIYEFKQTAAHEFGHMLGIGDAYLLGTGNATDEVSTNDMMWYNGTVSANEVEMVWEAYKTNWHQDFVGNNVYNKLSAIKYQLPISPVR